MSERATKHCSILAISGLLLFSCAKPAQDQDTPVRVSADLQEFRCVVIHDSWTKHHPYIIIEHDSRFSNSPQRVTLDRNFETYETGTKVTVAGHLFYHDEREPNSEIQGGNSVEAGYHLVDATILSCEP